MEEVYVEFPADLKYLHLATSMCHILCDILNRSITNAGLSEDIELCISEACTNAILHGDQTGLHSKVFVRFQVDKKRVILQVGDQGKGFDMSLIPQPDLNSPPDSGLGLYIISSKMDEVRYIQGDNGNYLEMTKNYCGQ